MSYILNALRKSEQERQESDVDTVENRIQEKQQTTKKISIGMIALVILNGCFLVYFVWPYTQDEVVAGKSEVLISVKSEIIKEKPALKIEKKIVTTIIDEQPIESSQLSIAEQIKNQKAKKKLVNTAKAEIKQKTQKLEKKFEAIKQQEMSLKQESIVTKVLADKQQNKIPFLSTLDYEFRRKVPDLNVNVYVYAEKKQNRFIMIEMTKYLSGQQIASGMTLKEIRMNSLVVEYKNREFQIKRK